MNLAQNQDVTGEPPATGVLFGGPKHEGSQQLFSFAQAWAERSEHATERILDGEDAARFRAELLEQMGLSVVATDLDGWVCYANRAAAEFYGWRSEQEMQGRSAFDLVQPRASEAQADEIRKVLREGRTWSGEFWVGRAGETAFPALVTSSPLHDSQGKLIGALSIATEITERKRVEQQLRRQQSLLTSAVRIAGLGSWEHDLLTGNLDWSEETLAIFGLRREEFRGRLEDFYARIHPADLPRMRQMQEESLRKGGTVGMEYRIRRADGQERILYYRGETAFSPEGKPLRRFGMVLDITARKVAEERIAQQAALLDCAREAIVVKDLEGRIIYWNKGSERLYGWTAEEAVGQNAGVLLPQSSRDPQAMHAFLESGEWQGELTTRAKNGRILNIEERWTLVRDAEGKPQSILAIDLDITEKKKLEAQYLRAQRMESIGTLAGGIAHDLNNVLAPILMSLELLRDYIADPAGHALIGTLVSSAQRGADLVRQVLSFARGMGGERIIVNAFHVAREIQKIVRDTFPKNIEFSLKAERDLWTMMGDPTQLHQVLMNLCVNARDAMPSGGTLEVCLANAELDEVYCGLNSETRPGPYLLISVSDTGSGIPAEIMDKIFDPFFTTKELSRGTGLGLATVAALVKSHGGFLNLYTEVGKGTKFKLGFPANRSSTESAAVGSDDDLPRGNGECILLVDDEEAVRKVGQRTLEMFGYQVLLASNGAEAISRYVQERARIGVVLTDMAMPVMDGMATITALRTVNPEVRIIASSGLTTNGEIVKAFGAGVKHFVPKPYTAVTLLRTLRAALSTGRGS